ncbi:MAG: hypothetical protein HUU04_05945 [Verrucomicrobiae bacterium]|nr:hypothetical protein [Verrucomicrobiae bacterium]
MPLVRVRFVILFAAGLAFAIAGIHAQETSAPASAMAPSEGGASPFTNAIPRSVFRDLPDERDPFSPVGYVKPQPPKPGEEAPPPKPVVDFEAYLVVTGISAGGGGAVAVATLASGGIIEPGETYPIKNQEGATIAEYKVISISEEKVVALFEGKEYQFKVRGADLERFIEKEDPNENKKP